MIGSKTLHGAIARIIPVLAAVIYFNDTDVEQNLDMRVSGDLQNALLNPSIYAASAVILDMTLGFLLIFLLMVVGDIASGLVERAYDRFVTRMDANGKD